MYSLVLLYLFMFTVNSDTFGEKKKTFLKVLSFNQKRKKSRKFLASREVAPPQQGPHFICMWYRASLSHVL